MAVERRAVAPITPLVLFADRSRSGAYLARMLLIAGMTGMFFFLTQFMQDVLGYSPLATGFGFLPITISLFIASQASARVLVERFGERPVMIAGIALSTLGLLWLTAAVGTTAATSACSARSCWSGSATAARSCR